MNILGLDNMDPTTRALLSMGSNLLQASGPSRTPITFGQALGGAMGNTMSSLDQATQAGIQNQLNKQQIERNQQLIENAKKTTEFYSQLPSILSGGMDNTGTGPDVQKRILGMQLLSSGVPELANQGMNILNPSPIKLGAGESLVQPGTYTTLTSNPKEQSVPSDQAGYTLAKTQGYKGSFMQYKQDLAKAGASNINVGQTPENAGKVGMLQQAQSDIKSAKDMLFPGGKLDKGLVAAISVPGFAGLPGNTQAREIYSRIQNAVAAKLRLETGAAANAGEIENIARRFMPTLGDTDQSAADKLDRLSQFMSGTLGQIKGYKPTTSADTEAMDWAKANPTDPRAQKIMELNNAVQP